MNPSKCSAFWKHTNIRADNKIFPCCRFKKPIAKFNGDVKNILNLPEYQKLRQMSEKGEYIPECEKCYYEERQGKKSLRQQFNEEYTSDTVKLEFLEIGFDNICNLACDGCWEEFSSKWAEIKNAENVKKINILSTKNFENVPNTLTKVLFLGGEPLMTNRHNKFLSTLHYPENVSVVYNTNGTFLFKKRDIELLKKFKSVEIIVSIDGVGELNDRVRSGSNWYDILIFLEQLKKINFNFSINTVIHKNNWRGLNDLSRFISENNYKWTINILTYPENLNISNLLNEEKQELLDSINQIDLPNKGYIINHLFHEIDDNNENKSL